MDNSIIVDGLSKDFDVVERNIGLGGFVKDIFSPKRKTVHAVKDVSFTVQDGELVGFIGPNGAGKTTTLKMLTGLLFPSSGFVSVLGEDPWARRPEFLKEISLVMGQKNQLWWDLTPLETFDLNRAIYEIPVRTYNENLKELVGLLEVEKLLKTPVRKLSLGQRMKMELVASLIHKPKVLFLDEPTIGLDVIAQTKMRDFIYEYNKKEKATIILTSHNMGDLVNLARRVIVIADGEILFDGIFEDLINKFAKEKLIKVILTDDKNIKNLKSIGEVKNIKFPQITISVPRSTVPIAASEILQNYPVEDLTIEEEAIEEVIARVFNQKK